MGKKDIINEIYRLLNQHKLTQDEVSAYFVEQKGVHETEDEIRKIISDQIKIKKIEVVLENSTKILKSVILENNDWHIIDRAESLRWLRMNTILDNFYIKLRGIYSNLIKKLENNKVNNYNLIYDAGENLCEVLLFGKKGINFASNDYLGLARHPQVIDAATHALKKYGNGTGGARVMVGTTPLHKELEGLIAEFKGTEDAVVFSSGYMTNLALLSMLASETVVLFDRLDHASIIDGIKLSDAEAIPFKHNDTEDLEKKLNKIKDKDNKLIFVEGIYSMDGDIANIP